MKNFKNFLELTFKIMIGLIMAAIMLATWLGLGLFIYLLFN